MSFEIIDTYGKSVDDRMVGETRKTADYHPLINRRVEKNRKKLYELEQPTDPQQIEMD